LEVDIQELKAGNEQAFRQLMHIHSRGIFNLCLGMIPNREDAEDITQDVFVEAYKHIATFREGAHIKTWLFRIALNKCYDHIKYSKRQKRHGIMQSLFDKDDNPIELPSNFQHPGITIENKEHAKALYGALATLPENQKTAFTLYEMQGMDYKQIAETMSLSVSAVESLLSRARGGLRKKLQTYYTRNASS
jgi:RNA polymerase sigma factor (sigma-70 family)